MKMLDDAQMKKEAAAAIFGGKMQDPTFGSGYWHNPESSTRNDSKTEESLQIHTI